MDIVFAAASRWWILPPELPLTNPAPSGLLKAGGGNCHWIIP